MEEIFRNVLHASFYGSVVIAAVIMLRLALKRAPKKYICLLWLLAGVRLLCPFEIESSFSLQPDVPQLAQLQERTQVQMPISHVPAIPEDAVMPEDVIIEVGDAFVSDDAAPTVAETFPVQQLMGEQEEWHIVLDWNTIAAYAWLAAACGIGLFSILSYLRLKRQTREAVHLFGNVWECAGIDTAFILGFVKPRIYIPVRMPGDSVRYILEHERTHLERGDHWVKLVGFIALAVHWFNPLVWAAYLLLCRDIEMACDESVVRNMGLEERKRYSAALLACSTNRIHLTACPVAFGEVSVKHRILSVLNYRKKSFWISLIAIAAIVFVAICLLTNPAVPDEEVPPADVQTELTETPETQPAETLAMGAEYEWNYDDDFYLGSESYVWDMDDRAFRLYAEDETELGMTLVCEDISNQYTGMTTVSELSVDSVYWIEQLTQLTGGEWVRLQMIPEYSIWNGEKQKIAPHATVSWQIDWEELYGRLGAGYYRIGKTFTVTDVDGTVQEGTCYAKFWFFDETLKDTVELCWNAQEALRIRESYHVTLKAYDYDDGSLTYSDEVWKYGSDYLNYHGYYKNGGHTSGKMLRDGAAYGMYWEDDVESSVVQWNMLLFDAAFRFDDLWSSIYFTPIDPMLQELEIEGNTITLKKTGAGTISPTELVYTFDDQGNLNRIENWYFAESGERCLVYELDIHDTSADVIRRVIDHQDISRAPAFSWEADKAAWPDAKREGFANTVPQHIADAMAAIEIAKRDCTMTADITVSGEKYYHTIEVYYDEDAEIWKVVFTFPQNDQNYQAIYLNSQGITQMIVDLTE